jgi:catalase (peroxidase I)
VPVVRTRRRSDRTPSRQKDCQFVQDFVKAWTTVMNLDRFDLR